MQPKKDITANLNKTKPKQKQHDASAAPVQHKLFFKDIRGHSVTTTTTTTTTATRL